MYIYFKSFLFRPYLINALLPTVFLTIVMSCNDGRVSIANVNFDNVALNTCVADTTAVLFFKIQKNEALILELQPGLLKNQATTTDIVVPIADNKAPRLVYRSFTGTVTKDYFCSTIPAASPTVQKNISSPGGKVIISTTERINNVGIPNYEHTIRLENILLEEPGGSRIIAESLYLGTLTTSRPQ